jgi:anti-sigma factor RsiW
LNCQETRDLIHGYVDGELDLIHTLEIEKHLRECPACAQVYENQQTVRTALREGSLSFQAPQGLGRRIRFALRQAGPPAPARGWLPTAAALALVAAALAFVAVLTWSLTRPRSVPSAQDRLTNEVVAAHIRSLRLGGEHVVDIPSSDQHTVKPWFEGKVDFSPHVGNYKDEGFKLVGGRLDYLDNRPVAALVYKRRKHFINLFVWKSPRDAAEETQEVSRQGYNVFHWNRGDLTYWVISNLNRGELAEFVRLVKKDQP